MQRELRQLLLLPPRVYQDMRAERPTSTPDAAGFHTYAGRSLCETWLYGREITSSRPITHLYQILCLHTRGFLNAAQLPTARIIGSGLDDFEFAFLSWFPTMSP